MVSTSAFTPSPELEARLHRWAQRLQDAGIEGLADTLLSQGNPLPLLGAQVLWVLQPALGAVMPLREVGELAQLLGSESGLVWLRQQLLLDANEAGEAGEGD